VNSEATSVLNRVGECVDAKAAQGHDGTQSKKPHASQRKSLQLG
jgi:hypothetical protein